jgi:hypothetical protein
MQFLFRLLVRLGEAEQPRLAKSTLLTMNKYPLEDWISYCDRVYQAPGGTTRSKGPFEVLLAALSQTTDRAVISAVLDLFKTFLSSSALCSLFFRQGSEVHRLVWSST